MDLVVGSVRPLVATFGNDNTVGESGTTGVAPVLLPAGTVCPPAWSGNRQSLPWSVPATKLGQLTVSDHVVRLFCHLHTRTVCSVAG